MIPSYGTSIGFDAIAVALLGRSHPFGIAAAALLFGALRAGAGLMQVLAGIPVEIVDVIQAIILLFLAADVVVRRLFRIRAAGGHRRPQDRHQLVRGPGPLMDQIVDVPRFAPRHRGRLPAARLPGRDDAGDRPDLRRAGGPDRPRRPVRDHERAVRRGEHRHRGDDAELGVHGVPGGGPGRPGDGTDGTRRPSSGRRSRSSSASSRRSRPGCSCRSFTPGCRSRSGPTRSSAGRSSTSSPSA